MDNIEFNPVTNIDTLLENIGKVNFFKIHPFNQIGIGISDMSIQIISGSGTYDFITIDGKIDVEWTDYQDIKDTSAQIKQLHPAYTPWYHGELKQFSKAVSYGYLEKSPAAKIKRIKPPLFFSREEFDALLKVIDNQDWKDLVEFAINTGLRQMEILNCI